MLSTLPPAALPLPYTVVLLRVIVQFMVWHFIPMGDTRLIGERHAIHETHGVPWLHAVRATRRPRFGPPAVLIRATHHALAALLPVYIRLAASRPIQLRVHV